MVLGYMMRIALFSHYVLLSSSDENFLYEHSDEYKDDENEVYNAQPAVKYLDTYPDIVAMQDYAEYKARELEHLIENIRKHKENINLRNISQEVDVKEFMEEIMGDFVSSDEGNGDELNLGDFMQDALNDEELSDQTMSDYFPQSFLRFMVPGTKWCGHGHSAKHERDFGYFVTTDKCCKNHDHCPEVIEARATRYGLKNSHSHSKIGCKCEVDFRYCLKKVNTIVSKNMGRLYFNFVSKSCFKLEHPILRCKKYDSHKRCVDYAVNQNEEKKYQWFDNRPWS